MRSQVRSVDVDLLENQSKDVGTFKKKEGRKREEGGGDAADMGDLQKVWTTAAEAADRLGMMMTD